MAPRVNWKFVTAAYTLTQVSRLNSLWRKVWADLWQNKTRSWLAISSIAAGVFCVGALFGMIDLQLSQMDAAHRRSQPSHINLILRQDADIGLLEYIRALPGVEDVEAMTQLTIRFRRSTVDDWQIGTLIFRENYDKQRLDIMRLEAGSWPSPGAAAIENLSSRSSGVKLGDSIEFQTGKGSRTLEIRGIVRHPFVKPPKFGGQLYFFANPADAGLFDIAGNSFRQLLVKTAAPYSDDRTRALAMEIRNLLASHGVNVNATLMQNPGKHWGRPILAGINGVLQMMAAAALGLACVLIFNTVSAHIVRETDQIGVMKALGGSNSAIACLYLAEVLLLALIAIALALPFALIAAYFSSDYLLGLFNIASQGFQVSWRSIFYMLAGGLLTPLLAAIAPIIRGAAMTVRVAIASYGLNGGFGRNFIDRGIEKFGLRFLPTLQAAALSNLFRRKASLLLTQAVLIAAGVTFLVLTGLIASLNLTLDNEALRSRYTLKLGFSTDENIAGIKALITAADPNAKVENWLRQPVELSKELTPVRQNGSLGLQMLALPAAADLYRPLIESGRWLGAEDAGQRVLVINADTALLNGVQIGDSLDARIGAMQQAWRVIGFYRWLAGNNFAVEPVYAPLETLQAITGRRNTASFALVDGGVADLDAETGYQQKLRRYLEYHGVNLDVYTTQGKLQQRQFVRNQFQPVIATLLGLAAMIAAVGGIGLSGTLALNVLHRRREIGVLRAIGAPSGTVFQLFMLEGCLHGLLAWLLSLPLAYFFAEPLADELGLTILGIKLDYSFDWLSVVYWLAIVMLLAMLASYWPARQATALTVKNNLQY